MPKEKAQLPLLVSKLYLLIKAPSVFQFHLLLLCALDFPELYLKWSPHNQLYVVLE